MADGDGTGERSDCSEHTARYHHGPGHLYRARIAPEGAEGAKHPGELAGAEEVGRCRAGLRGKERRQLNETAAADHGINEAGAKGTRQNQRPVEHHSSLSG